jgi:lysozyme family protein
MPTKITHWNTSQSAVEALANPHIREMINAIIRKEGGYNDHKEDRGGATNLGISLRYARGLGLRMDLDRDGDVDSADIMLVDHHIASCLYAEDFYAAPRFHLLPKLVQPFMFDFAVNSGPGRAVIEMQEMLNDEQVGSAWPKLIADGRIGPMTVKAVLAAMERYGDKGLLTRLCNARQKWCDEIVQRDTSQQKFANGWRNRINSFRPN